MDKRTFDFETFKKQAAEWLKAGDSFFGRDGVLTPLLKEFVEEALDGEMDAIHYKVRHEGRVVNRAVYKAANADQAERNLDRLAAEWGARYPKVLESRRRNWPRLSTYYEYDKDFRRIMYTTNIIEGFHRQLRSVTKSKGAFPSDEALMKLLFLAQEHITSKWNRPVHNWNRTLAQLSILFPDRLQLTL